MISLGEGVEIVKAWEYLKELSELPHRGSGSPQEREAAEWLRDRLENLGYRVEIQPFVVPRHTLYLGPVAVTAALLAAVGLARWWPAAAFVVAALSFIPLVGELFGSRINFDLVLPKLPSQNVYAFREKPRRKNDRGTGQDVVVVAHYDTQWGSWLFAPWFRSLLRPFFLLTYASLALGLLAVVWRWIAPTGPITAVVVPAAVILMAVTGGFLALSYVFGRSVPGANDNGSGVAVALALAEQWAEKDGVVRLSFLFTGAEEVGMRGMHHFLKQYGRLHPDTLFVNLDNVGGGQLRYLLGEGMLGYQNYDPTLVALARRLAEEYDDRVQSLKNLLLPTDALLPAKAGFGAITFLATEADEAIPNYHWHTDTLDNAERATVEQTERFVTKFIDALEDLAQVHAS